jgi:hypothetical protein
MSAFAVPVGAMPSISVAMLRGEQGIHDFSKDGKWERRREEREEASSISKSYLASVLTFFSFSTWLR